MTRGYFWSGRFFFLFLELLDKTSWNSISFSSWIVTNAPTFTNILFIDSSCELWDSEPDQPRCWTFLIILGYGPGGTFWGVFYALPTGIRFNTNKNNIIIPDCLHSYKGRTSLSTKNHSVVQKLVWSTIGWADCW